MEASIINKNVAVEILEILNYLEKPIKSKIPPQVEKNLNRIKNKDYAFKIDKSKTLEEQAIMPETKEILSILYLKYCCSKQEANAIIEEKRQQKIKMEQELNEKYNPNNIFSNIEKTEIKVAEEPVQLIRMEDIPWHRKIMQKISDFLKNILRK